MILKSIFYGDEGGLVGVNEKIGGIKDRVGKVGCLSFGRWYGFRWW